MRQVVLCATQRCGSTMIIEDMRNTGVLGRPEEWFLPWDPNKRDIDWAQNLKGVQARSSSDNGVAAIKIMANQLGNIEACLEGVVEAHSAGPFGRLAALYADALWVKITRRGRVDQAISRVMARQTGIAHATAQAEDPHFAGNLAKGYDANYNATAVYRYANILREVSAIALEELVWEHFFACHGIAPHELVYEAVARDPQMGHLDVMAKGVGLSEPPPRQPRKMVKLANARNAEWRERFFEDVVANNFRPAPATATLPAGARATREHSLSARSGASAAVAQASNATVMETPSPAVVAERADRVTQHFIKTLGAPIRTGDGKDRARLRRYLLHHPEAAERIGLPVYQVPGEIHAMGKRTQVGDLANADLFDECALAHGVDLGEGGRLLDFGCSSGRLTRVLSAYYPAADCYGCDPREASIAFARANIPGARFFVSPQQPPLAELEDQSMRAVVAISVWSHFSEALAKSWFDEMHRIVRSDGVLIFSVGGLAKLEHHRRAGKLDERTARARAEAISAGRYHFVRYARHSKQAAELDVTHWGTVTAGPAFYEAALADRWTILEFLPGRMQKVQDVYVIRPKR